MSILFLSDLDPDEMREWNENLHKVFPEEELLAWSPASGIPLDGETAARIDIAIVANPPKGHLARLTSLRFIQSAWAGVDALLTDATLPRVQLARLIDPTLAAYMAEGVLAHVLALHRQAPAYLAQQRQGRWRPLAQPLADACRIGILGMGEMGAACAKLFEAIGFQVTGWSRSGRSESGVSMLSGEAGMHQLLSGSHILVNLLPLTPQTKGILNAKAFALMPPGASLINVGRGGHVVIGDLLAALDEGRLSHAVLDVFETEPLAPDDPLWSRTDLTITPHIAAPTDPMSAARAISANVTRFRTGKPIIGLVGTERGY